MLSRREFLKGLGATALATLLARHHGANLLPTAEREGLVAWGRENGVIRPQWKGTEITSQCTFKGGHFTIDARDSTFYTWDRVMQEWTVFAKGNIIEGEHLCTRDWHTECNWKHLKDCPTVSLEMKLCNGDWKNLDNLFRAMFAT